MKSWGWRAEEEELGLEVGEGGPRGRIMMRIGGRVRNGSGRGLDGVLGMVVEDREERRAESSSWVGVVPPSAGEALVGTTDWM